MSQQAKVVELVLPEGFGPVAAPEAPSYTWWIVAGVAVVLLVNVVLVWWRVKKHDPLKAAFEGAAAKAGLSRGERQRVRELAGENMSAVALLISETAMSRATASSGDDPLVVNIRQKLRGARV